MLRLSANGPGLGDAVVLTAVLRELRRQRPDEQVHVSAGWGAAFANLPNVVRVDGWGVTERTFPMLDRMAEMTEHQVVVMARHLGLEPPDPTRIAPEVLAHLAVQLPDELRALGRYVTISTTPGPWTRTKDWVPERWQELVDAVRTSLGVGVVQVGGVADAHLKRCDAKVMGEPLPLVARVLAHARVHVAPVTGTMHLATAVGTRVVALFMGREDPRLTGYARNTNLTTHPSTACAPCWRVDPCPYRRDSVNPCAALLTVGRVLSAVEELMS